MTGSSVCIAKAGCTLYKNVQPAFALSTQKTRQKARSVIYTNTPLKIKFTVSGKTRSALCLVLG